jgi:cyclophilin family peptidyl-prolyl cis-trans isomerase
MTLLPIHPARRLAVLAATVAIAAAACSSAASSPIPTVGPITPAPSVAPPTAPPAHTSGCPTSAPAPMKAGETATVTVETSKGTIVMKIEGDLGPNAAGNFVALAECGFYDGVVFHRLVPGFVIQGGDPTGTGGGGPGYTIKDEPVKGEYKRGTLAMARTPEPDTQGSQFFIVLDDQAKAALDSARTYAIFGEVVSGMDVVDAIAAMPNSGEPNNTALDPVSMDKVTVTRP